MVGQDDDRALGIEKADYVVVVGNEAASMRDVTQTGAAEREQLLALGGVAVRKDIRLKWIPDLGPWIAEVKV